MKTKYFFHGLVYLHNNFFDNPTMQTVILILKTAGGQEKEKEPKFKLVKPLRYVILILWRRGYNGKIKLQQTPHDLL